ncbi:pentapeptide repeat-containing protein [Roseburia faecis]|uniref:pentapeptide repeat-containing protein n=1 Tax=Roseburia faecis TaxID=301302 RepID=UPI003F9EA2D4
MGRGKQRRKYKQKKKRMEKAKRGKLVRFDLQNSGRKYSGFRDKYCYQTNIHRLIYKDAKFQNVKFQASNITNCNYKNASFKGIDFCNSNLKNSTFKGARFENVIFMNCNLKGADFTDAKFKNVYFIMTNIEVAKGVNKEKVCILNKYPKDVQLDANCEVALFRLGQISKIYKYHVLHVSPTKINMWVMSILLEKYGEGTGRALNALVKRKDKRFFYTVASYMNFIESYLKL